MPTSRCALGLGIVDKPTSSPGRFISAHHYHEALDFGTIWRLICHNRRRPLKVRRGFDSDDVDRGA